MRTYHSPPWNPLPPSIVYILRRDITWNIADTEARQRTASSPLDVERVRKLVLALTGDAEQADKEAARFVLDSTRR